MKKAVVLFMVLSVLILPIQPQKNIGFKYSALIRNSAGNKIVDKELTIRVSICKSANGDDIVYTEEHETRTNNLGVVNFTIGKGEIGLDDLSFEGIDWSSEIKYFLKVEVDYNNTGNYVKMGVSQLLSVPYAMYANNAETADRIKDSQTIMQDLELSDNILTISGKDNATQVDLSKFKNPEILDELGKKANKNEVYTKGEVDLVVTNKIDDNNRASNSSLEKLIDSKADKDKVYSKEEIDNKLESVTLSGEFYSKSETDSKLDIKADKSEVDSKFDVKADKSDTYTKTETDSKINNKADKSTVQTLSDNMDSKLDKTNISDDLLSNDSESVLSANMGNKLKSDIERLSDDINLKLGTKVDVQKGKSLVADDILTSDKQMVRKDKIEPLEINDIQTLENTLNTKAEKNNIYSKQEINDKILTGDQSKIDKSKIEQLEISDINNLQSSIDNKSNKDEVYSRSEIDSKVDAKQDKLTETPEFISNKGEANGYAGLDSEGKIPASHLPDLNISETFVVNNNTEIFSLPSVNKGNVVVVKNDNKTYINKTGNNNDINDWVELSTPNSGVTTVNNQTGNVTVDKVTIGLSNVDNISAEQIRSGIEERHLPNAAVKKSDMTNYYSKDEINTKILNNDNSLVAKSKIEQLSIDNIDQLADALLLKANGNDVYSKSDINTKVLNSDQTKVAKDKIEKLTVADIQNLYGALALKADTNTVYTRSKINEILIEKVNQSDFDNLGNIVNTKLNSSDIADDLNTKVDKVSGKELISSNILTSDKSMIAKDKIEPLTVNDIESLNDKLDLKSDINKVFTKEEISELLNEKENKLGFIPENTSNKGKAGGYAPLNSSGKINESYLPDIAVPSSNTVFVDDEAGLLSISANKGDMAILKDSGKSYVNNGGTSGTINDWTEMSSTGAISSINGKVGAVEITKQDINLENVENKSGETIRSEIVDANIPSTIARKSDLDNYSTTTDINQKLESKSDKSSVYNKTEIDNKLDNLSLDNVYTKSETDNKLEDKANKSDVYTTTQTDNMLTNKAEASDVYSKTDVDSKISDVTGNINTSVETLNIEIGKKVNKSEVYTITDIDNKILTDDKQKVSKSKIETLEIDDINGLNAEINNKLNKNSIADYLTSTDENKVLSAKQGKILKDQLDLKSSASEVSNLKSKIAVSENEILKNSSDISELRSQKLSNNDVRNYLTSDEVDKPLSAAQGKILYNELNSEKNRISELENKVNNTETEITNLETNKANSSDVYNKSFIESTILTADKTKVDLAKIDNIQTILNEKQSVIYDGLSENFISLPSASDNTNKLWYVKNISTAYLSDGTNWIRKSDVYSKIEIDNKLSEKQEKLYDETIDNAGELTTIETFSGKVVYVKRDGLAYKFNGTDWDVVVPPGSVAKVNNQIAIAGNVTLKADHITEGTLAIAQVPTGDKTSLSTSQDEIPTKFSVKNYVDSQNNLKQNKLGFTPEDASKKGANNGYAPLNTTGKVPVMHIDKTALNLNNVENTSDADKPVSSATQTALNSKANSADVYVKADLYNKSEVDTKILTDDKSKVAKTKIEQLEIGDINALQSSLDNKLESTDIAGKANSADVYVKADVYNKSEVDTKILTDDKSKVAKTKIEQLEIGDINALQTSLDNKLESTDIAGKANSADVYAKTDVYNKSEVDTKILTDDKSKVAKAKIEQLEIGDINALQTSLDNKLESTDIAGKANSTDVYAKADVYNKSEVDTKILTDDKSKVAKTKIEQLEIGDINALQTSLDNKLESTDIAGKANSADVYVKADVYNKSEVDTKILTDDKSKVAKTKIEQLEIGDINALQTSLDNKLESADIAGKANSSDVYAKADVYTKSEVDSKSWDASKITTGTINYERLPIATSIVSSATDDWIPSEGAVKKYVDSKVVSGGGLWTANGSNAYFNTGNVGIGIDTPKALFHVNKADMTSMPIDSWTDMIINDSGSAALQISGGSSSSIFFGSANSPIASEIRRSHSNNILHFYHNGIWSMAINESGNIGIGNSNPSYKLHVNGSAKALSLQLNSGNNIDEFSNDAGLSGNANNAVPTEQAVKTYVDNKSTIVYKNKINNSTVNFYQDSYFQFAWDSDAMQVKYIKNSGSDISGGIEYINGTTRLSWTGYLGYTTSSWQYFTGRDLTSYNSSYTPITHGAKGVCHINQYNGPSYRIEYSLYYPQSSYKVDIVVHRIDP